MEDNDPVMAGNADVCTLSEAPLRVLIYLSTAGAQENAQADTALALAHEVQAGNRRKGLTGLLLGNGSSYMQVLEGSPEAVGQMFATVSRDPRHRALDVVLDQPATERTFPDTAMLGLDLDASPLDRRAAIEALIPAGADRDVREKLLAFSVFD